MSRVPGKRDGACLLSSHPMVTAELVRLLGKRHGLILTPRLPLGSDPHDFCAELPQATLYAVDACASIHHDVTLVRCLLERFPEAKVLVLSETFTEASAIPLLRLGVKGLLSYAEVTLRFREALAHVAKGRLWVSRKLMSAFVESVVRPARHRPPHLGCDLSRREQEVLRAVLDNRTNKEIGTQLNISERTAKFHVANLLKKVGLRRRSDLIAQWWQGCDALN